ncbi:MAG: hypothetical protein D6796_10215, partial [Caldilineae bacterium]
MTDSKIGHSDTTKPFSPTKVFSPADRRRRGWLWLFAGGGSLLLCVMLAAVGTFLVYGRAANGATPLAGNSIASPRPLDTATRSPTQTRPASAGATAQI